MLTSGDTVRIAGREIRQGKRPFVIAEVAQAHDGSLGMAHSFIDIAAEAGADAIKFQTHIADAESTRDEPFRVPFSYEDESRYDYWKRMEFTEAQWDSLAKHARDKGLIFLSSCFSVQAVEMVRRIGMPAWKVGSGELRSTDVLDAMSSGGEPLLLSTGLGGYHDIARQVERLRERRLPFALFQCTSRYPTPLEEIGLNVIDELHERFGCPVGLSDHSGSIWPSVAAMARGAALIEVHIALHRRQFGPDTAASLDPAELRRLIGARDAMAVMAEHPVDKDGQLGSMAGMQALFGKSLALKTPLAAGTILDRHHLLFKKPGGGLGPEDVDGVVGRRLLRDVPADRLLRREDLEPGERVGRGS
jgi:N,N'-diacetyllegionaminate synthase